MSLQFKSIADEEWREYEFANGSKVRVSGLELNVSPSGGHRIKGADGLAHYIPSGWIHLYWKPKNSQEMFQF